LIIQSCQWARGVGAALVGGVLEKTAGHEGIGRVDGLFLDLGQPGEALV
jgi:hypothetical protein